MRYWIGALGTCGGTIATFPIELPARERRARAAKHGEGNWIGSEYDR